MTLILLAFCGAMIAASASRSGIELLERLKPRQRLWGIMASLFAVMLIPMAFVITSMALLLHSSTGGLLTRCGRLIAAIVAQPTARPGVTGAMIILGLGVVSLGRGLVSAWRRQRLVRGIPRSDRLDGVVITVWPEPVAFTAGLLRPRVVISKAFMSQTPAKWQRVVLAHEEAHRKGRHPLLLFIADVVATSLPFPAFCRLSEALKTALEERADEMAAAAVGDNATVAEAIAGVALYSSGGTGFEGREVVRIRRLMRESMPVPMLFSVMFALAPFLIVAFALGHAIHCGNASIDTLGLMQCRGY